MEMTGKMSPKRRICAVSMSAFNSAGWNCPILANFLGIESEKTVHYLSSENHFSCVHVLHNTWKQEVLNHRCETMVRKHTKNVQKVWHTFKVVLLLSHLHENLLIFCCSHYCYYHHCFWEIMIVLRQLHGRNKTSHLPFPYQIVFHVTHVTAEYRIPAWRTLLMDFGLQNLHTFNCIIPLKTLQILIKRNCNFL